VRSRNNALGYYIPRWNPSLLESGRTLAYRWRGPSSAHHSKMGRPMSVQHHGPYLAASGLPPKATVKAIHQPDAKPPIADIGRLGLCPDDCAVILSSHFRRSALWSKRKASHKKRMTRAIATAGAAKARNDMRSAPPNSPVAMTELPRPPVKTVEWALSTPVAA